MCKHVRNITDLLSRYMYIEYKCRYIVHCTDNDIKIRPALNCLIKII